MASDCNTFVDTLSGGSDIEIERVETSDLEELEDDDYLPVPRDPLLRAQSPMVGVTTSMQGQGNFPQTVVISEPDKTLYICVYMQFGCIFWIHIFYLHLGINILTLDTCCCLYWITKLKCPFQDNYKSVTFPTITFLFFNELSKFFLHDV